MSHPHTVIAKARELYIKYRGRCHRAIEHEMHMAGCLTFTRRVLYSRTYANGRRTLGWIDQFGWRDALSGQGQVTSDEGKLTQQAETRAAGSVSSDVSKVQSPKSKEVRKTRDKSFALQPETSNLKPETASFPEWLKRSSRNMTWDWAYQKLIYDKLQQVSDGTCKRLMIFLPPRHGKSELVTVRYSAWRLLQDPSLNIILGSYNQRLANRFSRKVRITLEDAQQVIDNGQLRIENGNAGVGSPHVSKGSTFADEPQTDKSSNSQFSTINSQFDRPPASSPSLPFSSSPLLSRRQRLNTVSEWETGLGGGVRAVGVGGGITGFGAGLVIIDDPVKSRAEAESKTYRDKVWEWFSDDLYTRLEPNASIILIQTRWHEDDLAGRLLREASDGGEHWDVINLPALSEPPASAGGQFAEQQTSLQEYSTQRPPSPQREMNDLVCSATSANSALKPFSDLLGRQPGDALCPERFSREDLLRIKRQLGSYSFSALYQQRPTPPEGGLFKRKWFKRIVDRAPDGLKWVRAYDLAVSTSTSADYTASFRCALDKQTGELYIADGFRRRIEFPEQRKFIVDRILNEPDTEHGIELALHGQAFIQDLRREHKLFGRAFRGIKVTADKFTRALSWANLAEEGKIVLVRGSSTPGQTGSAWIDDFLDEVTTFPNSTHDDQLDAVSLAVQMLEHRKHTAIGF